MLNWSSLPFNLRWVKRLIWPASDDGECVALPVSFPEDPDEEISLLFRISLNEFTRLLSAIEKGATLSYPDNEYDVVWSFLRSFDCPMPICEEIIECVETDADTKNAVINMLLQDARFVSELAEQFKIGFPVTTTGLVKPLVDNCDEDVLFGSVTYIINSMDNVNVDVLQILEAQSNESEKVAEFWAAIPLLDQIPIADFIEGVQGIMEDFEEGYLAAMTTTYKDELRCALFCQALDEDNCTITLDSLWRFFGARVGTSVSIEGLASSAVEFIVTGNWEGSQLVDIMMYFQIVSWRFGARFVDMRLTSLEMQAALGANNPDHDWVALGCDCGTDNCVDLTYDTHEGTQAGIAIKSGIIAGDKIVISDITGTYTHDGAGPIDYQGFPGDPSPLFMSETVKQLALMFQISGMPQREWYSSEEPIEFIAPVSGDILCAVNLYINIQGGGVPSTSQNVKNDGVFAFNVCVEKGAVELEPLLGPETLTKTGTNEYELGPTYFTGNYLVGGAKSVGDIAFRVVSYDWGIAGAPPGSILMGGGTYNTDQIPSDVATTFIWIYNVPAGRTLTIEIERA